MHGVGVEAAGGALAAAGLGAGLGHVDDAGRGGAVHVAHVHSRHGVVGQSGLVLSHVAHVHAGHRVVAALAAHGGLHGLAGVAGWGGRALAAAEGGVELAQVWYGVSW